MKVEITVPEEYMGDVIGDVNSRRGRNRRYYRITGSGRDVLNFNKEKWNIYVKQVNQIVGGNDE